MIIFKILLVILIVAPFELLSCAMLANMWGHVISKNKGNQKRGRGSKASSGMVRTKLNSERNENSRR